jgi:hypothetical protein
MAKDETELGITGKPIPKKKRSPAKQHKFEKERRRNLGTNVGGHRYQKDVKPYYNPIGRTFEEFMNILDEKFSAPDPSKPQSPKPTVLPRSREANIGPHDDWKDNPSTEWNDRPKKGKKLRSRASAVVGTQRRQDKETGVREETTLTKERALEALRKYKIAKTKKIPSQQAPLRKGEVRTFNRTTGKWESNLDE